MSLEEDVSFGKHIFWDMYTRYDEYVLECSSYCHVNPKIFYIKKHGVSEKKKNLIEIYDQDALIHFL